MLEKKVNSAEAKKILKISDGNLDLISEKYQAAKMAGYRNLIAFMLKAIQEDWQMPQEQCNKPMSRRKVNTRFHNFEQRTDKYTAKELEDKVLRR